MRTPFQKEVMQMKRFFHIILFLLTGTLWGVAQVSGFDNNDEYNSSNTFNPSARKDSTKNKVEAPRGMFEWNIDRRFGEVKPIQKDTLQYLFMNTGFTSGMYGEYNTTGNLGAPRLSRIFTDRPGLSQYFFTQPYDFFIKDVSEHRFTNTLSPITRLDFYSCGDRTDGEDNLHAMFAVNVNKQLGVGFRFDYLYGRGYYQNQSTSLFDYTMWGSYRGDRYQAHVLFSIDHMKNAENGGITDDNYITHPENYTDQFSTSEIPTQLQQNWNRNHNFNIYISHRYNVGFNRKVPMTEEEKKAHQFAMQSKKEAEEKEKKKKGEEDSPKLSGRPDGAKIKGSLKKTAVNTDSLSVADRIAVPDKETADSLIAAEQKEAADTAWLKNEYVPVTSFIHTLDFTNRTRTYIAHQTPAGFYQHGYPLKDVLANDSINDDTKHFALKNTFAVALLEGFNKYVKSGLRLFLAHELRHFELPDTASLSTKYNENNISVGAQLLKHQGSIFHYTATGELGLVGEDAGNIKIDANADVNLPLMKDTLRVTMNGYFHNETPSFLLRHYHSRNIWWDNEDLKNQIHTHLEGNLSFNKTKTTFRVAYDNLEKYTYLSQNYTLSKQGLINGLEVKVNQSSKNISVVTLQLMQKLRFKALNWDNRVTYQKSTGESVLPLPRLNIWTNLYLDFKIAKVLKCHFGAQATYFTGYEAPEYNAQIGQYVVQENEELRSSIGKYPFVDVYANFTLKGCRFFIMMSHLNAGTGSKNYFLVPHCPTNERVLRLGLSWNFYN